MVLRCPASGFGFADEQPVLLTDGDGRMAFSTGVVVDLDASVFEIHAEHAPQCQRVVDRSAHGASWQVIAPEFDAGDGLVDALGDHAALAAAHGLALAWSSLGSEQLFPMR